MAEYPFPAMPVSAEQHIYLSFVLLEAFHEQLEIRMQFSW